nr:MAG TPA: Rubrerythrin [Caudoviricetes sp.]
MLATILLKSILITTNKGEQKMEERHINMIEPVEDKAKHKPEKILYYTCVDCGGVFPVKEAKMAEWFNAHGTFPCHCANCKKRRENFVKNNNN